MTALYTAQITYLERGAASLRIRLTSLDDDPLFPDATAAGLFLLVESATRQAGSSAADARLLAVHHAFMQAPVADFALFFAHAPGLVHVFDPVDSGGEPGREGAWMEFDLQVQEAALLAHLSPGQTWRSTCPDI